jgi:hypothetical protein
MRARMSPAGCASTPAASAPDMWRVGADRGGVGTVDRDADADPNADLAMRAGGRGLCERWRHVAAEHHRQHCDRREVTTVIMTFDMPSGAPPSPRLQAHYGVKGAEYIWHCHILEHEVHDMRHALVVVQVAQKDSAASNSDGPRGGRRVGPGVRKKAEVVVGTDVVSKIGTECRRAPLTCISVA